MKAIKFLPLLLLFVLASCSSVRVNSDYDKKANFESYKTYAEIGFPLTHDAKSRVGRLRGYGNAIVAPVAEAFIEAVISATSPAKFGGRSIRPVTEPEDLFAL